jgi:hypothetical protein
VRDPDVLRVLGRQPRIGAYTLPQRLDRLLVYMERRAQRAARRAVAGSGSQAASLNVSKMVAAPAVAAAARRAKTGTKR